MRVLVAHNRYRSTAPSGENRVVDVETSALRRRGHEVELFERRSDDIAGWPLPRRVGVPARVLWSEEVRRDLTGLLRRYRPDVLHVHNTFPLLSPSVLHAARDTGTPVVATLHNYKLLCASGDFFRDGEVCHRCADGNPLPGAVHGCYRGSRVATLPVVAGMLANRSAWRSLVDAYIAVTAAQRDRLVGLGLDPARVHVKHNLVPAPAVPAPVGVREPAVAYLGRLDAAKGVPLLMRAWDRYLDREDPPALRLVVAGGGPLEPLVRSWAADRPSVRVTGFLPEADCRDLVAHSRAVVLPSAWEETFGLVAVEAMAHGTPTLVADHGSLPELVTAGVDGAVFRHGDPAALAAAFADVAASPERYRRYGEAALRTYQRSHDPDRNLDLLEQVYAAALSLHPRRSHGRTPRAARA